MVEGGLGQEAPGSRQGATPDDWWQIQSLSVGPGLQEATLEGSVVGDDLHRAGAEGLQQLGQDVPGWATRPAAEPGRNAVDSEGFG